MKKILILLILLGSLISCDNNNKLKEVQILFKPSFLYNTRLTIDIENKIIEQYTYQDRYYLKEWVSSNSYKQHRKDTLIIHYQKSFSIDHQTLNHFLSALKKVPIDSTIKHKEPILDGINFRINKINKKDDTISLISNITRRNEKSELEYKVLDPFFDLLNKSIDDYNGICGIENIQDYFSYGLPVKKVSDKPLEYRVWGSIVGSRKDNQEFITFLENLPDETPIIFDLRNGKTSYALNEVLEEFSKKKEIYLYGDRSALNSKKIMDEIKLAEKNGERLSKLRIKAYKTHERIYNNWNNNKKIRSFLTRDQVIKTIANAGLN